MEDKSWAEGLTREQFAVQFQQRYPHAGGVIPDPVKWLGKSEEKFQGIEPFNEELISEDVQVNKAKPKPAEEGFRVECPGCKVVYVKETEMKVEAAFRAHKRHCAELRNVKDQLS